MAGGVIDGQPVSQAITNPAFIIKNADDTMSNKLGFNRLGSGPSIADIQQAVNNLYTATGVSESQSGTTYNATPGTISNGQNYETALRVLANKFDAATGHRHTGLPGDAPPISGGLITDVPLTQIVEQGSLFSASGSSNDVSSFLSGKTPSTTNTTKGVIVNNPQNRVAILSTNYDEVCDDSGNLVYGRLTYSVGVWTLSYYSLVAGLETAYSFPTTTIIQWFYKELFEPLISTPVYQPLGGFEISYKTVKSLAASGLSPLYGDVVFQASGGISLFQSGQNIGIFSTVAAAGVSSLAASGASPLTGDVTLSGSGGTSLLQVGQDIRIYSQPFIAPVTTSYLSGSGTHTLTTSPRAPLWIEYDIQGGGGGGSGSGSGSRGSGSNGGDTTFGPSTASSGGGADGNGTAGGTGGAASLGVGVSGLAITGGIGGGAGQNETSGASYMSGGSGGNSYYGGAGGGGVANQAGTNASANSGAGGGGGGSSNSATNTGGRGGGAGGFVRGRINNPASSYSYSVGTGGGGGSAGTNGTAGGNGGSGSILITEHFQ